MAGETLKSSESTISAHQYGSLKVPEISRNTMTCIYNRVSRHKSSSPIASIVDLPVVKMIELVVSTRLYVGIPAAPRSSRERHGPMQLGLRPQTDTLRFNEDMTLAYSHGLGNFPRRNAMFTYYALLEIRASRLSGELPEPY